MAIHVPGQMVFQFTGLPGQLLWWGYLNLALTAVPDVDHAKARVFQCGQKPVRTQWSCHARFAFSPCP